MPRSLLERIAESRPMRPLWKAVTAGVRAVAPYRLDTALRTMAVSPDGAVTEHRPDTGVALTSLRTLSRLHEPTRACVWKRIRQVQSMGWEIVAREPTKVGATLAVKQGKEYFSTNGLLGGPGVRFRAFVAELLEDLLTLDAICLYRRPTLGEKQFQVELVDPTTIRLLSSDKGRLPEPPANAYVQIIQGKEVGRWSREQMYYEMLNPRSDSLYGMSPVEILITVVQGSLRSALWNIAWFTDSNIPAGMLGVPQDWTPQQIKEYMEYFNSLLVGNAGKRQGVVATFVGTEYKPFVQPKDMQFERFQLWLLKLTCALFDINPAVIGFAGDTYKVAQEEQISAAKLWGLQPLLLFLKELFDDILANDCGRPEVEWKWESLEHEDALKQAQSDTAYGTEYFTINEVRKKRGADPIEGGLCDSLFTLSPQGLVVLGSTEEEIPTDVYQLPIISLRGEAPQQSLGGKTPPKDEGDAEDNAATKAVAELRAYRRKALRSLKKGASLSVSFTPDVLAPEFVAYIGKMLEGAEGASDAEQIFAFAEEIARMATRFVGGTDHAV
jgi:hypothetical protein